MPVVDLPEVQPLTCRQIFHSRMPALTPAVQDLVQTPVNPGKPVCEGFLQRLDVRKRPAVRHQLRDRRKDSSGNEADYHEARSPEAHPFRLVFAAHGFFEPVEDIVTG